MELKYLGLWENVQTGIKHKLPVMCSKEKYGRVKGVERDL